MPIVTRLSTLRLAERPNLLWVEIETDDGVKGLGETFRGARAVEAVIHEQVAPWLIGREASRIEEISRYLSGPYLGFGSASAEVRAASAVDIALWDLAGRRRGVPVHEALGGGARTSIPVYNTCAGYTFNTGGVGRRSVVAGEASAGPYDDQVAFMTDAGKLAESLLAEGIRAMKIWPFDIHVEKTGGQYISLEDLKAGLEPFRKVRAAVGDAMEVMAELHSLWNAPAAERICRALADVGVLWVEDPIAKMNDVAALADLRRRTGVPICGSETLGGVVAFRDLIAADAVDVVMADLTWTGGLTVGRKIATLAEAWAKPFTPHDCTGPVTLMAGLHLAIHAPTAFYQEIVRANLATWYRDLATALPVIQDGRALAPTAAGLGIDLLPEVWNRPDATVREARR